MDKQTNKEEPAVVKHPSWGKTISLPHLYTAKGHGGVFHALGGTRSGTVALRSITDQSKTIYIKRSLINSLVDFVFYKTSGDKLMMWEVLDNIDQNIDSIRKTADSISVDTMNRMVPGYDPKEFKPNHAKKMLKWYDEIKSTSDKFLHYKEEGEKDGSA